MCNNTIAFFAVIFPLFHKVYTSSISSGIWHLGLPRCFPFFLAASIPSLCLFLIVKRSCSAILAMTSIKIFWIISKIHFCPSGTSINDVGKSNIFNLIFCSLNHCSSCFISALFLDRRSKDVITNVSPFLNPSAPF